MGTGGQSTGVPSAMAMTNGSNCSSLGERASPGYMVRSGTTPIPGIPIRGQTPPPPFGRLGCGVVDSKEVPTDGRSASFRHFLGRHVCHTGGRGWPDTTADPRFEAEPCPFKAEAGTGPGTLQVHHGAREPFAARGSAPQACRRHTEESRFHSTARSGRVSRGRTRGHGSEPRAWLRHQRHHGCAARRST